MFCPRCGQQQVSEEIKFCSRCGLPLHLISEILINGGFLPQLAELYKNNSLFTRRNGLLFSLFWFMLFVFVFTPLFGIAGVEELAAVSAILGTMGGLILSLASLTILKKAPKINELPAAQHEQNNFLHGNANRSALPPQQVQPAQSYVAPKPQNWRDTNDLVQPRTVTEGTTKLLEKEE